MRALPIFGLIVFLMVIVMGPFPEAVAEEKAGPVVLKPTLVDGSEYIVRNSSRMVMQVPNEGQLADQTVDMEQSVLMQIDRMMGGDGDRTVKATVKSIRLDMRMPGMAVTYDSSSLASRDAPIGKSFRNLIDNRVEMVYDETDQFVKMASTDAFVGSDSSPFGQQIGPEQVRELILSSLTDGFPEQAVGPGDSWTHSMQVPLSGMGEIGFEMQFAYKKDTKIDNRPCAVIEISGSVDEKSKEEPGYEEQLKNRRSDDGIEKGEFSGTIVIDKELRLARETEMSMDLVLRMPSALGADEIFLPIQQKTKSSVEMFRRIR